MELIAVVIAQAVLSEVYSDIMEVVSVSYNNEQTSHNTLIKTYIMVLCTLDADMIKNFLGTLKETHYAFSFSSFPSV